MIPSLPRIGRARDVKNGATVRTDAPPGAVQLRRARCGHEARGADARRARHARGHHGILDETSRRTLDDELRRTRRLLDQDRIRPFDGGLVARRERERRGEQTKDQTHENRITRNTRNERNTRTLRRKSQCWSVHSVRAVSGRWCSPTPWPPTAVNLRFQQSLNRTRTWQHRPSPPRPLPRSL